MLFTPCSSEEDGMHMIGKKGRNWERPHSEARSIQQILLGGVLMEIVRVP